MFCVSALINKLYTPRQVLAACSLLLHCLPKVHLLKSSDAPLHDHFASEVVQVIVFLVRMVTGHSPPALNNGCRSGYAVQQEGQNQTDARACPACAQRGQQGLLGLKLAKAGGFIGCSNYPDCKFTRPQKVPVASRAADQGWLVVSDIVLTLVQFFSMILLLAAQKFQVELVHVCCTTSCPVAHCSLGAAPGNISYRRGRDC